MSGGNATPELQAERPHSKAPPSRTRRVSQNARTRLSLLSDYEDALGDLGRIEAEAGPTLKVDLGRAKRFQAGYEIGKDRSRFVRRRLGQRSGLLKLMQGEIGTDHTVTDRVQIYVRHILQISANVAALTGSQWSSIRSWLRKRMPALESLEKQFEADFATYLAEARDELARRFPSGDPNLHTGPTPADIADELATTTEQLRQSGANVCSLTSVDPEDRKTRDRKRKEIKRRKDGMVRQPERNMKKQMQAVADRLGCSLSKVYRMRGTTPLDAFVAAHSSAENNVSAVTREIDGGHFFLTDTPANDDTKSKSAA